jgi:hypothetical protein
MPDLKGAIGFARRFVDIDLDPATQTLPVRGVFPSQRACRGPICSIRPGSVLPDRAPETGVRADVGIVCKVKNGKQRRRDWE